LPDEPGVAQDDALATHHEAGPFAGPGDLGPVEFGGLRVEHCRIADIAVGGAVVIVRQGGHALDLDQGLEPFPGRGLVAEPGAQGQGPGLIGEPVLIDELVAQAGIYDPVALALRGDGQAGCGDVDAQHHGARAQALHRERVVDLGGLRVVDRIGLHGGQRQVCGRLGCGDGRKARALGEEVEQKALPVELVARIDGTCLLQQIQRRGVRGAAGFYHGLVFGCVLVGAEQDFVELLADGLRAFTPAQLACPFLDLLQHQLFLLDGSQRLLQDFGRGLLEAALASAAEVVRRIEKGEQRTGLLGQRGVGREIVARQVGKAEFVLGGELPGQG